MINIIPTPVTSKVQADLITDVSKTWKVGQTLHATAERNANAQDKVLIRMGQSVLEAKTPVALKAGDSFTLVVKSLGDTPVLSINTAVHTPQLAAQNLKSFIAQQQDLTALLQLSQRIANNPTIPAPLKQLLAELGKSIPSVRLATQAMVLQELVRNSGIFLESKINQHRMSTVRPDIKSQLLKLSALLRTIVQGLHSQPQASSKPAADSLASLIANAGLLQDLQAAVEGGLARITSQQLAILTRESESPLLLMFDLYFKDGDGSNLVHFVLEQEKSTLGEDGSAWKITLDFEFIELGPIQAQLNMSGNRISAVFIAENELTTGVIAEQIDQLYSALGKIGFDTVKLAVREGDIIRPNHVADSAKIVDEKA